ncbi:MAG: serine hydrolase [Pseudomonadota bacterium]
MNSGEARMCEAGARPDIKALFWRCFGTIIAAAALAAALGAPAAAAPRGGFIVFEAESGRVLHAVRSRAQLHPASLTKMMTVYLAFEAVEAGHLRLNQRLVTSRYAAEDVPAVELGLRRGERITVRDAIEAASVHSANDAAVVLAEAIAGTETAFARLMTRRARDFGMRETTFRNATGFTANGQLTTARDMAIMSRRLWMDFPEYYEIFSKRSVSVRGRRYGATNGLLGEPGVDGIKTGFTRAAGYNLAASAERDGKRVTVVLLGGRTKNRRNNAVKELLDDGFTRLDRLPPYVKPTPRPQRQERAAPSLLVASASPIAAPLPQPRPESATKPFRTERVAARGSATAEAPETWSVQLGAFFKRTQAQAMMKNLVETDAPGLRAGYRSIVTGSIKRSGRTVTVHRVRFTGLAEREARDACAAFRSRKAPCALVPPQGWADG